MNEALTKPEPKRRPLPLSTKLAVCLRTLGVTESEIDWSHEPALKLRAINDDGTDWKPPQHDPRFIEIRSKAAHAHLTFKDNGTGRGDLTAIAQSRDVRRTHDEHVAAMQRKLGMSTAPAPRKKWRWAKRKMRTGRRR